MDFSSLIEAMQKVCVDETVVKKIESLYDKTIPENVKKIISLSKVPIFTDEWRTLSTKEICNATEYLEFDFKKKNLVPLIDAFDNNFIVFDLKHSSWEYVNIVDGDEYAQSTTLEGLV